MSLRTGSIWGSNCRVRNCGRRRRRRSRRGVRRLGRKAGRRALFFIFILGGGQGGPGAAKKDQGVGRGGGSQVPGRMGSTIPF